MSVQTMLFGADVAVDYNRPLDKSSRVMLQSGSNSWCSPAELLEPVRRMGPIVFDPFSNSHSIVDAARSVELPENSLLIDWPTDGLIYINPPFGDELDACAQKIGEQAERGAEMITVVPARCDTVWWQQRLKAQLWLAWRGRIRFLEPLTALMERHQERVEKAKAAGLRPPSLPRFEMVTETLARGDAAPFALAVVYHGPREDLFCQTFAALGRLYRSVGT